MCRIGFWDIYMKKRLNRQGRRLGPLLLAWHPAGIPVVKIQKDVSSDYTYNNYVFSWQKPFEITISIMFKNVTLPQPGTNIFRKTQNTKNTFSLRSISEIGFHCRNISCLKYKVIFCFCQKAQCATCDDIMHIFKTLKFLSIDCGELLPWFWRDPESKHVGIPF